MLGGALGQPLMITYGNTGMPMAPNMTGLPGQIPVNMTGGMSGPYMSGLGNFQ